MKPIKTIDFSSILKECCDDEYQKFNGSIFVSVEYALVNQINILRRSLWFIFTCKYFP